MPLDEHFLSDLRDCFAPVEMLNPVLSERKT
jgi:hypothetical protein